MSFICHNKVEAFNELYSRYSKRMLYYFFRMLGSDKEKAQDFLQDLFLKVVEKPEMFNTKRKFSTWLFSVAHNMCKNEYRSQQVRKVIDKTGNTETAMGSIKEVDIDLKDFTEKLYYALDEIDENHKTAFLLRHREGFSIKEIGEALGCPEGTVKSKLFYTIKKLSQQLHIYNPNHLNNHSHEHTI